MSITIVWIAYSIVIVIYECACNEPFIVQNILASSVSKIIDQIEVGALLNWDWRWDNDWKRAVCQPNRENCNIFSVVFVHSFASWPCLWYVLFHTLIGFITAAHVPISKATHYFSISDDKTLHWCNHNQYRLQHVSKLNLNVHCTFLLSLFIGIEL